MQTTSTGNQHYWLCDKSAFSVPLEQAFQAQFWQSNQALTGKAAGRGTTVFFEHQARQFALRHYRRGGLAAKISTDNYFYTGLKRNRAFLELDLLNTLQALKLPVPNPIAARIVRSGVFYQADLITEKIAGAQDLAQRLYQTRLSSSQWQAIAQCIANFHNLGVDHPDLNLRNIMLDDQDKVWLIDFDRGVIGKADPSKAQANLDRLKRSLVKELKKGKDLHWNEDDWTIFEISYYNR